MKLFSNDIPNYTDKQLYSLTVLRILIGWHFLYEGLSKLFNPVWTSSYFLEGAVGPLAGLYNYLALSGDLVGLVDLVNVWLLISIGLSLFLGFLTRPFKIMGIILIALYYFAYPPFIGLKINAPMEGSYWIVNKTLIEAAALYVLYIFPTSDKTGIDRFLAKKTKDES